MYWSGIGIWELLAYSTPLLRNVGRPWAPRILSELPPYSNEGPLVERMMYTRYGMVLESDRPASQDLERQEQEASLTNALNQFHELQSRHPFWSNRLFGACRRGHLTIEDFRFIFSQYFLYSKNFTRYIAALMANSDNDLHRSLLSENLWEEGGGADPEKRHAELFRKFLRQALSIDLDAIEYLDSTVYFVREYLDFCLKSSPMAASALLSLGTEGIVARMYSIFVEAMRKAGIDDSELEFFHIHMQCDDKHAATLEEIMRSYSEEPEWYDGCLRAMDRALTLRCRFFEGLYEALQHRRLKTLIDRIQARESLAPMHVNSAKLLWRRGYSAKPLY